MPPETIKNMGLDIPKAVENRSRGGNQNPSLRRHNWIDQAAKDFEYYENCTPEQLAKLGKEYTQT